MTRVRISDVAREAGVPVPRLIPVTKSATPEEFLALSRIFPQAAAEKTRQYHLLKEEINRLYSEWEALESGE